MPAEETREQRRDRIRLSRLTPPARKAKEARDAGGGPLQEREAARQGWLEMQAEAERSGDEAKLRAVRRGLDNNAAAIATAKRQRDMLKGAKVIASRKPRERGPEMGTTQRPRARRRRSCRRRPRRSDGDDAGPGEPEPPSDGGRP